MIVLLDIEWIEKGVKHLTQLSAVRTDENWNPITRLEVLVRPDDLCFKDPQHVAFGGIRMELFKGAFPEDDCVRDLSEWLEPGDEIWVWAKTNKQYLIELWQRYLPEQTVPAIQAIASEARDLAKRNHHRGQSPYDILTSYGSIPLYPEHRASNDTEALRQVIRCTGIAPDLFSASRIPDSIVPMVPVSRLQQRKINQDTTDRTGFNFIYLKGSTVFHRRTCKAYLSAKSESEILGSVYYETAAKDRRPCRICNPVPLVSHEVYKAKKQIKAQREAFAKCIVNVKLITGETIATKPKKVLGWCHCRLHKGALNKPLLKEHDCLSKNCHYLEINHQAPYWNNYKAQKEAKEKKKLILQAEKMQYAAEDDHLRLLTESWQSYLDDMESDMMIVRVAKDAPSVYRIFYVSDNSFADGNRYPVFLETLKFLHPQYRINLRHIKDVDGHFVTTEEYLTRARK